MFPRHFADNVPPAGIKSGEQYSGGEHIGAGDTFKPEEMNEISDAQKRFRSHRLGEPGERTHQPGIIDQPCPSNLVFGVKTQMGDSHAADCLNTEPHHRTAAFEQLQETQDYVNYRNRQPLGHSRETTTNIPKELSEKGFGIPTVFGESAGDVIHKVDWGEPDQTKYGVGVQTKRNYKWTTIDPKTHSFGIKTSGNDDHITEMMHQEAPTKLVGAAVDRYANHVMMQDPNPLDPKSISSRRTMRGSQLKDTRDPSERPPAGISTYAGDITIGDTFAGMGWMDEADSASVKNRDYETISDRVFGIPTKPNPFPTPLKGPGRYAELGLRDEDFLKLRDKAHIIPVMTVALGLSEEEASAIFDAVAQREHRQMISVSEFHEEFKSHQ